MSILGLRRKIVQIWQWLVTTWRWLAEGKKVFLCLCVIAAAVAVPFFLSRSEVSIRSAGYVLQLLGMIFAIRGLLSIRAHFGQPPLWNLFLDWLKRFPKWRRSVAASVGVASSVMVGGKVRAEVWTPDNPDHPIEKRIEGIVRNQERLRDGQREHANSIDELENSYKEHKKDVAEQAKRMEDEIRLDLETLHTSDLITSIVGLVWLTVGITLSTMASELYRWLC